ncbi:MAG: penicillin-binding transpeptidase domain-containing protein [Clostridiales bacterium]|nr:penicillin-binding transpeptidase domain-containing protein [Clostridiales bacterium]
MKKKTNKILHMLSERLFLMYLGVCVLFLVIVGKFYQLQIIEHDKYANNLRASVERVIDITAPRGLIYDRYGRPLAINKLTNVVRLDQQVKMDKEKLNQVLLELALLLEKNGDTYEDNIPISKSTPFEYTESKTSINQFMYSIPYNDEKHRQELLQKSASEIIDYLKVKYDIKNMTDEEARKVIALRTEIYKVAYSKYKPVELATHVSDETIAYLEEHHDDFPSILVDVAPVRYYTEPEVLGNLLGYTRTITEAQYEEMKDEGYDKDDIVGHEGIEKTMESELRGQKGVERVEVDNVGRRVHTIEKDEAIPGNDVFLTIDLDLQKVAYESTERNLSEALIERLKGGNDKVEAVSSKEMIVSMLESSQLNLKQMDEAKEDSIQKQLYTRLMEKYNSLDAVIKETMNALDLLIQLVDEETGDFTEKEILLALNEQGALNLSEQTVTNFMNNRQGTTEATLIQQLETGGLKPNQMSIMPSSAASVVVDVHTGEVLALVGYPSYDANQMTTNFNRYYNTLFDSRSMLWNRALMTAKAPGSTFKMITGIAGLEEGVVTPDTLIYDTGVYEKVGTPAPKCWIHTNTGGGHGNTNLNKALEVSCNYYFYEVAYRLGLKGKTPYGGIDMLTKYVEMFGLDKKTGIELAESPPNISTPYNLVKNQVAEQFSILRKAEEERMAGYVEDVLAEMEKGIYPIVSQSGPSLNEQIDYLAQYELKRQLEPVLQDGFEDHLESLIENAYKQIQLSLQTKSNEYLEKILQGTINDTQEKSLKNKAKVQITEVIGEMISDHLDTQIKEIVDKIDVYDILDSYEYAYNTLYNRQFKTDPNGEIVKEVKRRLETLDEDEAIYRGYLIEKVKSNLITSITNEILSGLRLDWKEGTTVRTAIGQGDNAFTPLQMARYIAALANGKNVHDLRVISGINQVKEDLGYMATDPVVYNTLNLKASTLEHIYEGMYAVTHGTLGSARHTFKDFEIEVAGKTGTAQEGKYEHSWFVGFAPYKDPQIAVVTTVYNANGQGTYGQLIARDILTEYFSLGKEVPKMTLDNMFVE